MSTVPNTRSSSAVDAALVQQPRQLRRGEVRVEHEAGRAADHRLVAGGAQLVAARGGAAVLPDDGAVRAAAPVRRSHTTTVSRWFVMPIAAIVSPASRSSAADLAERLDRHPPDVVGVVLDPARAAGSAAGTRGTSGRAARPSSSTANARTPVVPASIAMTQLIVGSAARARERARRRSAVARGLASQLDPERAALAGGDPQPAPRRGTVVVDDEDPLEARRVHAAARPPGEEAGGEQDRVVRRSTPRSRGCGPRAGDAARISRDTQPRVQATMGSSAPTSACRRRRRSRSSALPIPGSTVGSGVLARASGGAVGCWVGPEWVGPSRSTPGGTDSRQDRAKQ